MHAGFRALAGLNGAGWAHCDLAVGAKSDLLDAMAWLTIPALIGPMIGPPIGGYLSTYYDWRWIFWMNLPLGLIALALTWWKMPELPPEHVQPLDWFDFALSGLGLGLAMMGSPWRGGTSSQLCRWRG